MNLQQQGNCRSEETQCVMHVAKQRENSTGFGVKITCFWPRLDDLEQMFGCIWPINSMVHMNVHVGNELQDLLRLGMPLRIGSFSWLPKCLRGSLLFSLGKPLLWRTPTPLSLNEGVGNRCLDRFSFGRAGQMLRF